MSDRPGYEASLRRGQLLRGSGRFADACHYLGEAIQANPNEPQPYLDLALARSELPGGRDEALRAIERAVALEPNSPVFLGYRAYLLSRFGRHTEALTVARRALELGPFCHIALLAQTNAYTKVNRWTEAEASARRLLEMNAEDTAGLNLLAQALRFQGRLRESRTLIDRILAQVPNDPFGQANAGYSALNTGDPRRARAHFLQALRNDPTYDFARRGLLQSLRERIWIYRLNRRIIVFSGWEKRSVRILFILLGIGTGGVFFGFLFLYMIVALTLQPISNLFLLLDPVARCALQKRERVKAILAGCGCALALATFAILRLPMPFSFLGGYLLLFALGIYLPTWLDAWRARRAEKLATGPSSRAP